MTGQVTALRSEQADLVTCSLPTEWGEFRLAAMVGQRTGLEHSALTMGEVDDGRPVLTRVHSECLTGDGFGSLRCDCGPQLRAAMGTIAAEGRGAIVYLRQEGRGIGLANKIRAYALQEQGADTVEANHMLGFPDDLRRYDEAASLLAALGISAVRLMTNNPQKIVALTSLGIDVIERIALHAGANEHNRRYLTAKAEKMGHLMTDARRAGRDTGTSGPNGGPNGAGFSFGARSRRRPGF